MATEYTIRKERHYNELKWLFCELYGENTKEFELFMKGVKKVFVSRSQSLRKHDREALMNRDWYKRSDFKVEKLTFGDLRLNGDFENPKTLAGAVETMQMLANSGARIIRVSGIEKIFNVADTDYQNVGKVHNVIRILRMVMDIAAPCSLLYGIVHQDPLSATAFFGSAEKPEFHIVCDTFFSDTLWQTVATKDARLLMHQIGNVAGVPKDQLFSRFLEPLPDKNWNLDFGFLAELQMEQGAHCQYLNEYFSKKYKRSKYKNQIYEMLHGFLMMQSGLLFENKDIVEDPELKKVFKKQLDIRNEYHVFDATADIWLVGTGNDQVLSFGRYKDGQKFYGLYNFSDKVQVFSLHDPGTYKNLLSGKVTNVINLVRLQPYSYAWLIEE